MNIGRKARDFPTPALLPGVRSSKVFPAFPSETLLSCLQPEDLDRVAKSPIRDFLLPGKGKTSFSLSSRIKDLQPESLIRTPRAGRV